mmetsp:Transcript_3739/g.5605  ORF Transcript_3739/g.5605 Transcript_3739/m.5605 type:complete len:360 (-) Transcript_3739:2559-3638(-)
MGFQQEKYDLKAELTLTKLASVARFKATVLRSKRFRFEKSATESKNGCTLLDLSRSLKSLETFYDGLASTIRSDPTPSALFVTQKKENSTTHSMNRTIETCPKKDASTEVEELQGPSRSVFASAGPFLMSARKTRSESRTISQSLSGLSLAFSSTKTGTRDSRTFQKKFLDVCDFLSQRMMKAVEDEMYAMFILVTLTDEAAAAQECPEQQNAVVIAFAKWYREANLVDLMLLFSKAIEYFLLAEYVHNPALTELPFDKCTTGNQLMHTDVNPELMFRVSFAGKVDMEACVAIKHVIALHMSLDTSIKMVKGTIDAKIVQCQCDSLQSYCRCGPQEFAPPQEELVKGMEALEGNCLYSC